MTMTRMIRAAALFAAAFAAFAGTAAWAETNTDSRTAICAEAPAKAARAGIDCATTGSIPTDERKSGKKYPSGPVSFGNGIVF
jgi:hypothetical protein